METTEVKVRTLSFTLPEDFFNGSSVVSIKNNKLGHLLIEQTFLDEETAKRLHEYKGQGVTFVYEDERFFVENVNPIEMYLELTDLMLVFSKYNKILLDVWNEEGREVPMVRILVTR